jgi:ATP-dependent DNA helicase RecG
MRLMQSTAKLRTFSRLGDDGRFYTAPEYPTEAWQEVIVNACAHRSYSLTGTLIHVRIFDDHFSVDSPGGFHGLVTAENIYDTPSRRNWWLMDALQNLDFVKCENEGTKRIRDSMAGMGLPAPQFEQKSISGAVVRVTLKNNRAYRKEWVDADISSVIGHEKAKDLDECERRLVTYALANGSTIKPAQAVPFVTPHDWAVAKRRLEKLKAKGVLKHHRKFVKDTNGYYEVIPYGVDQKSMAPMWHRDQSTQS